MLCVEQARTGVTAAYPQDGVALWISSVAWLDPCEGDSMTAGRTGERRRVGDAVAVPVDVSRPFTRRAGLASGLTDEQLQGAAYRRIFHGVYADAATLITPPARVEAARLVAPPDAFATHHTAARLLGGIVPDTPVTHLGTATRRRLRVTNIRLHRYAALPPLVNIGGQPVTAATRTFLDLAGCLDLVDLVVLGDSLVHAGRCLPEDLRAAAASTHLGWARAARRAAAYVRRGAESAPETRLRMLVMLAGLPEPMTQVPVLGRDGRVDYRLDLGWEEVQVALEYDGRHHIERREQWQYDLHRREDCEGRGWRFVVATSPDLYVVPPDTLRRIVTTLEGRGLMIPRVRDDWRPHFPGRGTLAG